MSRDKADTLLLLLACALVLAPHAGHLPLQISVACGIALSWRCWITFRGIRMPSRWLLLPIAVTAVLYVASINKPFIGRESGVQMLVLLLTFKLLEMHAKRDLFAVVFASFFIMLMNFIDSQSIGTALMMIAAVIAMLTAQLSFQYTGEAPPLKQRLRLGATIFAMAAPLTLVLFILFPRIQGPLWGLPSDSAGRSGLSDAMSPNNISKLALSDEVAFRVKFIDPPPPKSKLYWRGVVLGEYDGQTWTRLWEPVQREQMVVIKSPGIPIRHEVTLEPHGRRWLFALEIPKAAPILADNPTRVASNLQVLSTVPIHHRVRYSVASYVDFDLQPNESADVLKQWTKLPAGFNPNTLRFAARLRASSTDNAQLVNEVLAFFRNEKFSYTLEPPRLGRDAVDEFLFNTRAGFCEHYAGAFVVIMRALGIPSRVVAGYQGGEINPVDGFMTVRQQDAHAWAEVWLKGRGWVRIDPTAAVSPDRIELNLTSVIPRPAFGGLLNLDAGRDSWIATLRVNLDAANNAWNQWVLNYTPDRQRNFVSSLGFEDVNWRTLTGLMLAFGIVALAIVLLPLLFHRKRIDPVEAVYAALCGVMARRGIERAMHEGPRDFGVRLSAATSPLVAEKKAAAAHFLELFEAAKYGAEGKIPQAVVVSRLKSLLADCK
jgi:transglutaminase-like putative cysteine protease